MFQYRGSEDEKEGVAIYRQNNYNLSVKSSVFCSKNLRHLVTGTLDQS